MNHFCQNTARLLLHAVSVSSRSFNSTSFNKLTQSVPSTADVVVVGGGVIGSSTLYHLSKLGVTDCVLVERNRVTSGTTHHSTGLLWRLKPNDVDVQLLRRTRDMVRDELEKESGISPGFVENGSLFVALTKERLNEAKRLLNLGRLFGIDSHVLDPSETKRLFPLMNVSDLYGSLYSPGDGAVDPTGYVNSLIKAATNQGAKVIENCPVTGVQVDINDFGFKQVSAVHTLHGSIKTNCIVNCAGVWAPKLGAMASVAVPLLAMQRAYVITQQIDGIKDKPNVRDHDSSLYLRVQGEALVIGGYESNPIFWEEVEDDFAFSLFDLDWDVFSQHMNAAVNRVPIIGQTPIQSTVCGPESFTADHRPLMGEAVEVRGFYLGCGFSSAGIMYSGGCGEQLAHWIVKGSPTVDMFNYDIRRFHHSVVSDKTWLKSTSHEAYAKNHSIVFPKDQPLAGRNMRKSPFHELLLNAGCVYQEKHGWERPGWFATDTMRKGKSTAVKDYDFYGAYNMKAHEDYLYRDLLMMDYKLSFSDCHEQIGKESLACRKGVAVFDMSSFGKFYLTGHDAQKAADWICTNNVNQDAGCSVYTCMLNNHGGVESDLMWHVVNPGETEIQNVIGDTAFYITSGGGSGQHDFCHVNNIINDMKFDCQLRDITEDLGVLSVQGPLSRRLLQELTTSDLSNGSFPFGTHQVIDIADKPVRAVRLTFVGELGWELHIPESSCLHVYNALMEVGRQYGIMNAGYRSIDSLSIEKGYRHWHEDVRADDSPLEAGLGFTCKLKSNVPFLGREAIEKEKARGLMKKLCCFTFDSNEVLFGVEGIWRDGVCVGYLRRADYGYWLQKSIGYGYVSHPDGLTVSNEFLRDGHYTIEVMGDTIPATLHLESPFDPKNNRIKGSYDADNKKQVS
ncbi:sarcosine dehydrogenase, mitochondrial-like [Corticium candelabrum]|uniref:sarcosine dehydrogenase, mitochondrial-like n=1 Tax=Corticium candelabrum TaxID=121492 RepID=UPI002E25CAA5|nr:sarcosine dehydrogenase, mitochondrial-like [Corticium candelabrum]XP_062516283.1 sarcosine dehydrogenase, mitochondrial-like [Corticium candelabrum]